MGNQSNLSHCNINPVDTCPEVLMTSVRAVEIGLDMPVEKEDNKPPVPARIAVIIALSAAFWGLIIVCALAIGRLIG
jgi:hypothetical protein